MRCSVVIADDDKDFLNAFSRYMENGGLRIYKACNAKEALSLLAKNAVNIVISDIEMPGVSGFELLKSIRESKKNPQVPVILMSGKRISEPDMLEGYNKGSDDYIVKPFSMPVMLAKVKNILKKKGICQKSETVKKGILLIDPGKRTAVVSGKEVKLTRKEFNLLYSLVKAEGRVLSIDAILDSAWGYESSGAADPHTVESHISSLRKKIGPKLAARIKSVTGHGYKFE